MKWNAAHECFHWETVYGVMRPPVERGEYEEAIEGYAEAVRASLALDFYLPAVAPFEEWEIRAAVEAGNGYPAYLFGYAGAGLSLQQNPRLKRALIKSSGRQPWDALLREIPSAVLLGIEQVEGVIPNLPRAVIRLLEGLGDKEAPKRQLAAEFADPDLAEFERQHSLAQDLVRLRQALEQVKFSKRQREVYEADVETDRDTHEIARRLGISPDQVRKHRERYTDKLREQIEAD